MDGVRKWIGSSAPSGRHSARIESRQDHKSKISKREDLPTNSKATEAMALRNLNPVVSPEEEAEYQGSVLEFCINAVLTHAVPSFAIT